MRIEQIKEKIFDFNDVTALILKNLWNGDLCDHDTMILPFTFMFCKTNYCKVSVLKQHPCIISSSCRSEWSTAWVGSLLRSQGANIKGSVRMCFIQGLWGKICSQSHFVDRNSSSGYRTEVQLAVGWSLGG